MTECSEIVIEEGGELIINDSRLHGCSKWKGIVGYGNPGQPQHPTTHASLDISNSEIRDAFRAVKSTGGAILDVSNSTFANNLNHISIVNYPEFDHNFNVSFNNFEHFMPTTNPECGEMPSQDIWYTMVYMKEIQVGDFIGNSYVTTIINDDFNHIGVKSFSTYETHFNASSFLAEGDFNYLFKLDDFNNSNLEQQTLFADNDYGFVVNNSNNLNFLDIDFFNSRLKSFAFDGMVNLNMENIAIDEGAGDMALKLINSFDAIIGESHFQNTLYPYHPSDALTWNTGVYVDNSENIEISNSYINGWANGIEFYQDGPVSSLSEIRGNLIDNNMFGMTIAQEAHPNLCEPYGEPGSGDGDGEDDGMVNDCNLDYSYNIQLEIFCNEIYFNDVGIFGSGNLLDQPVNEPVTSNAWWNPSYYSSSTQEDWDILWENDGNFVNYVWSNDEAQTQPNNSTSLTFDTYFMNGSSFPGAAGNNLSIYSTNNEVGCWGSDDLVMDLEQEENIHDALNVYPNPFSEAFRISYESKDRLKSITVHDLSGRQLISEEANGQKHTISLTDASPGVYILEAETENGFTLRKRVVKE